MLSSIEGARTARIILLCTAGQGVIPSVVLGPRHLLDKPKSSAAQKRPPLHPDSGTYILEATVHRVASHCSPTSFSTYSCSRRASGRLESGRYCNITAETLGGKREMAS